jgi:hypothetical protein
LQYVFVKGEFVCAPAEWGPEEPAEEPAAEESLQERNKTEWGSFAFNPFLSTLVEQWLHHGDCPNAGNCQQWTKHVSPIFAAGTSMKDVHEYFTQNWPKVCTDCDCHY